ncbi:MAG: glycosyltransferase, partial [Bacteroidota bacterium]
PVISMTKYIENSMISLGRLPAGSTVIHNGVDVLSINAEATRSRNSRNRDIKRIGMIARLDPIKDHETLLEAFSLYLRGQGNPPAVLELIGEGKLRAHLERHAEALGVADLVKFHGSRGGIPDFLGSLDLFVMSTTREEGFGIVLIEALAAGVPIIASDVPACREVLRGGELGKLVMPQDPPSLAIAISYALRSELPAAPISTVEDFYSQSSMARSYLDLIGGPTK